MLLIDPFAFTSVRKFEPVAVWPDCILTWLISDELTARFAVLSPSNTAILPCTMALFLPRESVTFVRLIVIS